MKIASISLQNFKSYRDHQKVTFGMDDKCITIFEGQMGHGKSNFLNAFFWCLFGQYWDSDKSTLIDDPNPNSVDLFNKAELLDNQNEGSSVNLFIEIEFFDDDKSKYTLKRSHSGTFFNKSWKFEKSSKITLDKTDSETGEYTKFTTDEAVGLVLRFFPRSLSNYFLFRGENRAQLVKLQGKKEFQLALQELSKIEVFTRAESHLATVLDQLRSELAAQASDTIKREMEDILEKKKSAEKIRDEFEAELSKLIEVEQAKKSEYEYYRDKIKENQVALELKLKMENEENQIEDLQKQERVNKENKRQNLTRHWAALGAFHLFSDLKTKYAEAVNSGHYPPDISDTLINKIINELQCICGTHFKEDSDIYSRIQNLRDVGTIDSNLLHEIEKLTHEIERGERLVSSYPESLRKLDNISYEILNEIKSKQLVVNGLRSKIGSIDFTLEELQTKQDEANDDYVRTKDSIGNTKRWIASNQKDISNLETEFQKLEGKLDKTNLPAIKVDLAEKALRETRELKRKFESSIYDDLEKYTQENWEILVYDKLYYERVELDRNSMYFEVLDKNGAPSRAIMNTGHSILLVLSFISALIKIAKEVWEEEFPLILDAPLSEIGESALPKSLLGFGKIFNQTIVILKDGTINQAIYQQIKDKIGKRYWIEFNSSKQHSKITVVN